MGVFARADYGTATVVNSGDITAVSGGDLYPGTNAYGVLARGAYAQVGNSGNITANAYYTATGIAARSYYGTLVSTTSTAISTPPRCWWRSVSKGAPELGNVAISNADDISATGVLGGGVGIQAYSGGGNSSATNTGISLPNPATA